MATTGQGNGEAQPPDSEHPLAKYLKAMQESRDELRQEQARQEELGDNNSLDSGQRSAARAQALLLAAKIGELDASRDAFLVGIFARLQPPRQDVVDATTKLANDLAAVIVVANRPAKLIQIATTFLNGAGKVIGG